MKEYLFKGIDGTYKLVDHDCQGRAIEIPEGADIYINYINFISDGNFFYKDNFSWCYCENWVKTVEDDANIEYWKSCPVLWSRHTQPEELPFVDGGPMTELTYKNRNLFAKQREYLNELERSFFCIEDDESKISNLHTTINESCDSKLGNFVVDDTLSQRQSQYGEFKDVADTTQLFLDQFALGRLSSVQKESLHMICSKLSRIAHGDPNHVDSWHDIAGYATLVVKDIS